MVTADKERMERKCTAQQHILEQESIAQKQDEEKQHLAFVEKL